MPVQFSYSHHGKSGLEISSALPMTAQHADDLCVIRSMYCDNPNHGAALYQMNNGTLLPSRTSMGSWLSYGLATENADLLAGAVVGLGALGIVVEVTLQCVPTFLLRADEGSATLTEVLEQWPSWTAANDHVDLHWFPHTDWVLTKRNNQVDGPPAPLSGWRRLVDDELLANGALALVNEIGTRRPPWQARLNEVAGRTLSPRTFTDHSAAVLVSPRRVRFVECEYAVPRTSLVAVITELRRWIDAGDERIGIPVEIRSAAADDLWLSTGYQRENAYVAVHHYWRQDPRRYFAAFEAIVAEHGGRPHWGKQHSLGANRLADLYPRFADVVALRDRLDPARVFTNSYLDRVLGD
jgi:L-gulonolactone oxidase